MSLKANDRWFIGVIPSFPAENPQVVVVFCLKYVKLSV